MRQTTAAVLLVTGIFPIQNGFANEVAGIPVAAGNENVLIKQDGVLVAQVQSLDRLQAEQERLRQLTLGKPKAYEDKFMGASVLSSSNDDAVTSAEGTGFQSYFIESRLGYATADGSGIDARHGSEMGLRTEYRFETLNYGEFVIQADLRSRKGEQDLNFSSSGLASEKSNGRMTLRNLGFPLTPSVFADTSLGDITSETTEGLMRNYRFSLGSSAVRGASTHIFSRDTDIRAGIGNRGNLVGGPYPGFEATQGRLAWVGLTQRFDSNLFVGVQMNQAQNVPIQLSSGAISTADGVENVKTLAASVGYGYELVNDGDKKARITVLSSQSSADVPGRKNNARGVFIESGFKEGRYRNEMGAYWTAPGLHFGDYTAATDNRGAYWRVDHNSSRFNWGVGIVYEQQNPNRTTDQISSNRLTLNANAQQVIDRDSTAGFNASLNQTRVTSDSSNANNDYGYSYSSKSYYLNAYYQTKVEDWGRSRITATVRRNQILVTNGVAATGEEISWEHDWVTGKYETMRPEFTTTLGFARDRSDNQTQTYPTAGLVFRYWPDANWNVGGNLLYSSRSGNLSTSQGLSGSMYVDRILGNGWRLGASAHLNQAIVNVGASTLSTASVSRSNEKSVFAYLRYEGTNGVPYQALGQRSDGSAGGGSITGTVFFDINRDELQQANELGVPNVEIFLDDRYRVTSDRDGRFEFPLVTTGRHQLSLKLESIPLPWGLNQDKGVSVDVPLRGRVDAAIPVVRLRE